jgi:Methyltransferase domain
LKSFICIFFRRGFYCLKVLFGFSESSRYSIKRGYRHRSKVIPFSDTANADEYQKEVYATAKNLYDEKGLKGILDIGCGSAYKLLANFQDYTMAGVELSTDWLIEKYPSQTWFAFSDEAWKQFPAELIICADVIEHVENPDVLLNSILENPNAKYYVFSTPDRNLDTSPWKFGPPNNESHFREWTFEEFEKYMSGYFKILDHTISNCEQRTQMLVAERK